jgi:hypothetical protein
LRNKRKKEILRESCTHFTKESIQKKANPKRMTRIQIKLVTRKNLEKLSRNKRKDIYTKALRSLEEMLKINR